MHRTAASLLAAALSVSMVAASGAAAAQDTRYSNQDRYAQSDSAYFDYARVVRVDPVLQSRTPTRVQSSECRSEGDFYTYRDEDRYGDDRYADRRYDDRYDDRRYDDRYDDRSGYGTPTGRNVATVIGGIVGAALGSKVGGGSARYATAAVGSMVGGMAGREIYETTQRNRVARRGNVTVCDPVFDEPGNRQRTAGTNSVTAYDVTYEYAGREYITRTDYHPGDRIRVRVDVRPE